MALIGELLLCILSFCSGICVPYLRAKIQERYPSSDKVVIMISPRQGGTKEKEIWKMWMCINEKYV